MQYLTNVLDFVLQTEKDPYLDYILCTEEEHYLESIDCKDESCLDINWIKENVDKVNHVYMYARLLKDSIENE